MNDAEIYASAALVGAVAGMRSFSAPAIISRVGGLNGSGANGLLGFLQHPSAPKATAILAIGELIADKLPFVPARTGYGSLAFRAISGAFSAASICRSKNRSPMVGAILGAAAAAGATFALFELRKQAGKKLHLPDAIVALAEDALVATAGTRLVNSLRVA